jgi:polyisoprenyl-teichoic acid--peptidoglycan teichoic acid transferase
LSPDERPPREGLRLLLRALGGALLIMLLAAGATATAGLLAVDQLAKDISQQPAIEHAAVDAAPPGKPQTVLVLGSDRRWADRRNKANARSDTIMLLRLDPGEPATSVLSIPRDLKVDIPGHGTDKINAAYSLGGPALTVRTLKALLGIKINHVVNVNFKGFREAVDAVGCVYVDIDHRYYHSNLGLPVFQRYAEIDIRPGYQRLCGQDALNYVRFRHTDSDIVRAARQQDFLRAAKDQISTSSLIDNRSKLINIFGRSTQTDPALRTSSGLLKLLKLALFSAGHPVRQVPFPASFAGDAQTGQFVVASQDQIRATVRRFLHPARSASSSPSQAQETRKLTRRSKGRVSSARLVDARRVGENLVAPAVAAHKLRRLKLYFPAKLTPQGRYTTIQPSPRIYTIRDRAGRRQRAYRLVVVQNELEGQYFGIQGTTWTKAPLLAHPTGARTVNGRKLLLFQDGGRLRFVAWKRKDAVYWVSNSLSLALTNGQMIGIAASLTHL